MNKTKMLFGIGMVLAVLAVFTASAAADNVLFLEPSDITCGEGDEVTDVWVYLNATQGVTGFQIHLKYEDDIVDIVNVTSAVKGTDPAWLFWDPYWKVATDGHHYLFVTGSLLVSETTGDKKELAKISLKCLSPGTRPLEFLTIEETGPAGDPTEFVNLSAGNPPFTDIDGTFTCVGPEETFSKPLLAGWNLISLPLTATDMTVANIIDASLTGNYDALHKYDATTHSFVPLSSGDTMENGVGYFIHMTAAITWTYTGSAYTTMSAGLSGGLNMVGWLNCSETIGTGSGDALYSIKDNYYYVASWNATAQEYETYNPVAPSVFNNFTTMDRGEGYFISAKGVDTLSESC